MDSPGDGTVFDGLKRAAAAVRTRRDVRAEQRDVVQRYVYQHRKDLLALLRTSLGEVRVFPLAVVRMERGRPFELRPVAGVEASVEPGGQRDRDTGEVVVVVAGPDFRWRLTLPPLPGALQQLTGTAHQFAAAVTAAGRGGDPSGAEHGGQVGARTDPRQPA